MRIGLHWLTHRNGPRIGGVTPWKSPVGTRNLANDPCVHLHPAATVYRYDIKLPPSRSGQESVSNLHSNADDSFHDIFSAYAFDGVYY